MIDNLILGFSTSLTAYNIFICFVGCLLGQVVGVLPGLGPTATIAMLLTITYNMDLTSSLIMLSGIYYGVQYGGTITSIIFRIPGEASSIVTVLDGYPMAMKGQAGKALGIAAFGSFIAGTVGTILLSTLSPILARFALAFGPAEYSAVMVLGLALVIYLGKGSIMKSLLMGAVGLALGTIGMDPVMGLPRFTFGVQSLMDGVDVAIMAIGIFGIGEILALAGPSADRVKRELVSSPNTFRELMPNWGDWKACFGPITRGTFLGFLLGIIPGGGAVIASFASYAAEKKLSKTPERFGKGAIEGVAGPETANNAAVSGCFIPLLTLGIPSNVVMALLMGAFMIHGVTPGPLIITQHPKVFWGIITSMYVGNLILLIMNIPLIRFFVKIMEIPLSYMAPVIVLICTIGAFSLSNNSWDILTMLFFGILGFLMRSYEYEAAPLLLAFILGPILEKSVRQALIISQGSPFIFISRPISMTIIILTTLMVLSPLFLRLFSGDRAISAIERIKNAD